MQTITNLMQPGAQFKMSGSSFEIVRVKQDEVRVAPLSGGPFAHFKFKALYKLHEDRRLEIIYVPRNLEEREQACLRALTKAQVAGLNRRRHYVHGMRRLAPTTPCSQVVIRKHLASLSAEIGDQDPPAPSTIADWIHTWHKSGCDDLALANKTKPTRRDFSELDPKVLEYIGQAITSVYLTKQRRRKCDVQAEVLRLVANHNAEAEMPLQMPTQHIIDRVISAIDIYERDLKRMGKAYANRKHRAAGKSFLASEPLALCMADGQRMDVIAVEESQEYGPRKVLGRPFITVVMDLRTRCILAVLVTLQPFCGGTVLKAMTKAVVADPGKPRGVMSKLVVDNGCDYQDSGFIRFLSEVGITLEICGPRSPNAKANVERFFRTLNDDLIHKLPGTTFSNPSDRGDYRSQEFACLTLKDLQGRVQTWIDEIYHTRVHRSLGRAPIDVWNEETGS